MKFSKYKFGRFSGEVGIEIRRRWWISVNLSRLSRLRFGVGFDFDLDYAPVVEVYFGPLRVGVMRFVPLQAKGTAQ